MSNEQLDDLTQPQRDRLAFVELRVRFIGDIRRQDLVSRFGIQSAAATRDLAVYKELAPGNIDYDTKAKYYVLGEHFKPVFDFQPERVLAWLTVSVRPPPLTGVDQRFGGGLAGLSQSAWPSAKSMFHGRS
jgi:hypothetical protein